MVLEKNYCEQGFTDARHPLTTARDYPASMTLVSGTIATGSWKMERKTAEFEAFVKRNTAHSSRMSLHQSRHWSITPRWATMQWGTELTLEAWSHLPANTRPVQLVKIALNYLLGKLPSHWQKKMCCKQFTGKILTLWACPGKKGTMNLLPNKLSKIEFLLVALHECQRVSKKI